MIKIIKKNFLTLLCFAFITAGITSITNKFTQPIIKKQEFLKKKYLIDQLIPKEIYNNKIEYSCYIIKDINLGNDKYHNLYLAKMNKKPVAIVIETTAPDGYSGDIQMLIGSDFNGTIYGVRVIKHHETPGLGDKIDIRISNWIEIFKNKILFNLNDKDFALKKDGGIFDQFTGATITPRSVIKSVKKTIFLNKYILKKISYLNQC